MIRGQVVQRVSMDRDGDLTKINWIDAVTAYVTSFFEKNLYDDSFTKKLKKFNIIILKFSVEIDVHIAVLMRKRPTKKFTFFVSF